MQVEDFMECVYGGEIPPEPPDGLITGGWEVDSLLSDAQGYFKYSRARTECTERGMWAIVDQVWTRELADWIGQRRVLEIMAGRGWLAKALAACGVRVIATDNGEWDGSHAQAVPVFAVRPFAALEAVKTFGNEVEVLLVSWPPCGDEAICRAAEAWGGDRPIIYIGESCGGRNAPEDFFKWFHVLEDLNFPLQSWYGFHDAVLVGHYHFSSAGVPLKSIPAGAGEAGASTSSPKAMVPSPPAWGKPT